MRITNKLYAQHIGWMFKQKWAVQRNRVVRSTGAEAELNKHGIAVVDALDVIKPKRELPKLDIEDFGSLKSAEVEDDRSHPDWHEKACYIYRDNNVLLEGVSQAQVLLKTVEIKDFPKNITELIKNLKISPTIDKNIQNAIFASHLFDTEQEKLPIVKVEGKPMFVLPRDYGITAHRRNRLMISKLLYECEKLSGRSLNSQRKVVNNTKFIASLLKDDDMLQFNIVAETFMTSKRPIACTGEQHDCVLPDLFPIKHTITIPKENIYNFRNLYPVKTEFVYSNPHTIFLHFTPEDVGNLWESPVSDNQFQSRTMLKTFAVAAARAKQLYGDNNQDLPEPIVVQGIQTNGKTFHFGVFQLNTLNLDGINGMKNYWFHTPSINLFNECTYKAGRPILEGYNKDVFRYVSAFYTNC